VRRKVFPTGSIAVWWPAKSPERWPLPSGPGAAEPDLLHPSGRSQDLKSRAPFSPGLYDSALCVSPIGLSLAFVPRLVPKRAGWLCGRLLVDVPDDLVEVLLP